MGEQEDLSASLAAFGAPPRHATVTVVRASPGRRFRRAARAGALCWAIAAGCVFLPGLHFVLVPGFFVAGIAVGIRHLREQEVVARVRGACPRCGLEQEFAAGNGLTPTWALDCPACHTTLSLTLDAGSAARS